LPVDLGEVVGDQQSAHRAGFRPRGALLRARREEASAETVSARGPVPLVSGRGAAVGWGRRLRIGAGMISDIEDYFARGCGRCARFDTADCSTRRWARGLAGLRRLCREAGLAETVRWGHPCYRHARRNVALIGAFRGDFRLSFFEAALMKDPEGVLEASGPNTRHPDTIRFADAAPVGRARPRDPGLPR
jgi:hypothetical protein